MRHILFLALGMAIATPGWADLDDTLTTEVTVASNCELEKVQDLAFGTYLQANQPNQPASGETAKGVANVLCGRDTAYRIRLGGGNNAAAGVRRMRRDGVANCTSLADCIPYRIYRNQGRSQIWNIGQTFNQVPITAANHIRQHSFYGQFDNSLDKRPGSYTDTLVITVLY